MVQFEAFCYEEEMIEDYVNIYTHKKRVKSILRGECYTILRHAKIRPHQRIRLRKYVHVQTGFSIEIYSLRSKKNVIPLSKFKCI